MMNFNSIPGLNSAMGARQNYGNAFAPASNPTTGAAQNYGNAFAPATSALNTASQLSNQMMSNGIIGQITPRPQTSISPNALSNQGTINAMFGQAIPGTYNRNVGASPFMQMTSQGYVPPADPTNDTVGPDVNALITGNTGQPIAPPNGVQQQITPTYDLSNQ